MKWAYLQFGSGFGVALIPAALTVAEFKTVMEFDPAGWVNVPSSLLPLGEEDLLFDYISDYDTVTVRSVPGATHGLRA